MFKGIFTSGASCVLPVQAWLTLTYELACRAGDNRKPLQLAPRSQFRWLYRQQRSHLPQRRDFRLQRCKQWMPELREEQSFATCRSEQCLVAALRVQLFLRLGVSFAVVVVQACYQS